MKIKLDENLPARLSLVLSRLGHDTETVIQEKLSGQKDDHIWQMAQKEKRFFVTQDLDFSEIKNFAPGNHCGLMVVRLREPGLSALLRRIESIFQTENVEDWKGCFVVATEHKIRIKRPQ